jgi:hypothetical protein
MLSGMKSGAHDAAASVPVACGPLGAACIAAWPGAGIAPAAAVISGAVKVAPAGPAGIAAKKRGLAAPVITAARPALFVCSEGKRMGGQI